MQRVSTRTVGNLVILNLRAKTKERRMLEMAISTLFPQDLSVSGVKALDT